MNAFDFSTLFAPVRAKAERTFCIMQFATWLETRDFHVLISRSFFLQGNNELFGRSVACPQDLYLRLVGRESGILNWAQNVPGFLEFPPSDQLTLVKYHRAAHLLIEIATRSFNSNPHLLLGTNLIIDTHSSTRTALWAQQIATDILEPMRSLELDQIEFTKITWVLFFDPRECAIFSDSYVG